MIKFWNTFKSWQHIDKLMHFGIGALVAALLLAVGVPTGLASLGVLILAGAKELSDRRKPLTNTFDGWDAYWTLAGATWAQLPAAAWAIWSLLP